MSPHQPPLATTSRTDLSCHVLVVEDEQTIALNVVEYLEAQGFGVDIAYDGKAALVQLGQQTFDVLVLDLGLPRMDGLQVLQQVRHHLGLTLPILILTAREAISSKQACFEAGADDYLVKPFSLAELVLRVRALHRRTVGSVVAAPLSAGRLKLDRRAQQAFVGDQPVHLSPRGLQILEVLMRDPGRVVSRAEIEAQLWPGGAPDSDALRSQIHLLRRALSQAGFAGVETRHGLGWRLQAEDAA
ncbi:response regulator transcription factor [Variovorax sp. HJSM1_2]|uniref:response regulator transcription factor n=1 Tax=Variovorax sp. HJSM1_2 TaxID=3366263 RepID=UPI003BEB4846